MSVRPIPNRPLMASPLSRATALLGALLLGLGISTSAPEVAKADPCSGHFVNPITDVCWDCIFPMTLGSLPLVPSEFPDEDNPSSPVCVCPAPPPLLVQVGLEVGFWEPVRLEDVTDHAYCFPNLGGITIPLGVGFGSKSDQQHSDRSQHTAYHVHWYIYPVMYWMELLTDFVCLEQASFDIGYITELDPTWNDDEIAVLLSPETVLFDNPIAIAACSADCVATTLTGRANPYLFWCAGCQSTMTPMTGNIAGQKSQVDGSLLAAERFAYKLHRELIAWGTSGDAGVCGKYPMPIMDKRQYRWQMVNPTSGAPIAAYDCPAPGVASLLWESGKAVPVVGHDLGWLVWRKRNCCSF